MSAFLIFGQPLNEKSVQLKSIQIQQIYDAHKFTIRFHIFGVCAVTVYIYFKCAPRVTGKVFVVDEHHMLVRRTSEWYNGSINDKRWKQTSKESNQMTGGRMFTPRGGQTQCEAHSCTDSDTKRTFRLEELHTSESFCRQEDMTFIPSVHLFSYPTTRSCWDWSLTKLTGRELQQTGSRVNTETQTKTHTHIPWFI